MKKENIFRSAVLVVFVVAVLFVAGFLIVKFAGKKTHTSSGFKIVTSNYVAYDFARAVVGEVEGVDVEMLLKPGADSHSYEPTPQDIATLAGADLFIYNGGESEEWVEKLISSSELDRAKTMKMMELVELRPEEEVNSVEQSDGDAQDDATARDNDKDEDGQNGEHDTEYDEHIWTSQKNSIVIVDKIKQRLISVLPQFKDNFEINAEMYEKELNDIDTEMQRIIADARRRELVFADRFPFLYLARDYGLSYEAAFPGCSEQTEASSAVIAELIDKVKQDNIGVILKIELTSDKLAQTIAEATGAKILTLNSAHNISQEVFDAGVRYTDILRDNLLVLAEALN